MNHKIIYIASDHAGFTLKEYLISHLPDLDWRDLGPLTEGRVDYPDYADKVATHVKSENTIGVLICGSGQGMTMRANRYQHIRAALCWNIKVAELSRQHNDANVLCLGSRVIDFGLAEKILKTFLETEFEGGRHQARIDKMGQPLKG